jgi:hypothetical protein
MRLATDRDIQAQNGSHLAMGMAEAEPPTIDGCRCSNSVDGNSVTLTKPVLTKVPPEPPNQPTGF